MAINITNLFVIISLHKIHVLPATVSRAFKGQKCVMLQPIWEKWGKKKDSSFWYRLLLFFSLYNDTAVIDNSYTFLHTILSHHISFISDLKKESHMDTSEQNWWHQDAHNADRLQAAQWLDKSVWGSLPVSVSCQHYVMCQILKTSIFAALAQLLLFTSWKHLLEFNHLLLLLWWQRTQLLGCQLQDLLQKSWLHIRRKLQKRQAHISVHGNYNASSETLHNVNSIQLHRISKRLDWLKISKVTNLRDWKLKPKQVQHNKSREIGFKWFVPALRSLAAVN